MLSLLPDLDKSLVSQYVAILAGPLVMLGLLIPDTDVDIEAIAGMQHELHRGSRHEDEAVIEFQPRPFCPLYFDSSVTETEHNGSTNNIEEGIAPVVLCVE
jgi:hypothetical protein